MNSLLLRVRSTDGDNPLTHLPPVMEWNTLSTKNYQLLLTILIKERKHLLNDLKKFYSDVFLPQFYLFSQKPSNLKGFFWTDCIDCRRIICLILVCYRNARRTYLMTFFNLKIKIHLRFNKNYKHFIDIFIIYYSDTD
jgi:hypothetical protein